MAIPDFGHHSWPNRQYRSKARQIFNLAFKFGKNCQIKNLATCVPEIFVHLIPKPGIAGNVTGNCE
jgi:hypothetical protein